MISVFENLFPVVSLIFAGHVLRHCEFTTGAFLKVSDRLVYFIFFPVMHFWKIGGAPLAFTGEGGFYASAVLAVAVVFLLSTADIAFSGVARYQAGSFSQSCYRFNTFIGGLINFNGNTDQQGSFQSGGGYPDSLIPGIPGANTLNGSTALELLMYLKFLAAGIYTLCVNSDDGFLVTEGKNPKDRFATQLGIFDGGKGASDVSFTVAVLGAGTYPVRLIWENGNGELPGSGLNLEFFSHHQRCQDADQRSKPGEHDGDCGVLSGPGVAGLCLAPVSAGWFHRSEGRCRRGRWKNGWRCCRSARRTSGTPRRAA